MVFQLDLSNNRLCGLNEYGHGTYTAEGITAIADALRVNGALTEVRRAQLSSLSPDVLPLALTSGGPSCIGGIG